MARNTTNKPDQSGESADTEAQNKAEALAPENDALNIGGDAEQSGDDASLDLGDFGDVGDADSDLFASSVPTPATVAPVSAPNTGMAESVASSATIAGSASDEPRLTRAEWAALEMQKAQDAQRAANAVPQAGPQYPHASMVTPNLPFVNLDEARKGASSKSQPFPHQNLPAESFGFGAPGVPRQARSEEGLATSVLSTLADAIIGKRTPAAPTPGMDTAPIGGAVYSSTLGTIVNANGIPIPEKYWGQAERDTVATQKRALARQGGAVAVKDTDPFGELPDEE